MAPRLIDIKTADGIAPCHLFPAPQTANRPAVIFYMDAFGIRPAVCAMAERFAAAGYHVLLPNLYYRSGPVPAFDPAAFSPGPQRERIMALYKTLSVPLVMADTRAFLDFLAAQPHISTQVGCVGYCMGGAFALAAAGTFPDRVRAAASLHGARLATDQPDSPHLLAPRIRGAVYVGIAGLDLHFTPEEQSRLQSALAAAQVPHTLELYPDVKHGFAVTDMPAYDQPASERHFARVLALFHDHLPPN